MIVLRKLFSNDRERNLTDAAIGAGIGAGAGSALLGAHYGLGKWGENISANAHKKGQRILKDKLPDITSRSLKRIKELRGTIEITPEMRSKVWDEATEEVLGKEKFNELKRLKERSETGGRPGKIAGWISKNIIGEKANKSLGKKASGLFRGNKTAAAITAIAAPTLISGGIAYGVGHKKKNNK